MCILECSNNSFIIIKLNNNFSIVNNNWPFCILLQTFKFSSSNFKRQNTIDSSTIKENVARLAQSQRPTSAQPKSVSSNDSKYHFILEYNLNSILFFSAWILHKAKVKILTTYDFRHESSSSDQLQASYFDRIKSCFCFRAFISLFLSKVSIQTNFKSLL